MNKLDYITNIHFVGVGGVSMSALCLLCKRWGKIVSGSDIQKNRATSVLIKNGVKVYFSHNAENVSKDVQMLVYNGAIKLDNPEIVRAKELGIKIVSRGELLGYIGKKFEQVVAVAGTHGKSTTTSLIAGMFLHCNNKICAHIGAEVPFLQQYYIKTHQKNMLGNLVIGDKIFVTEACEYKSNFLYTKNYIGVITNVEKEHLDYFKTEQKELQEFEKFARNSKYLIVNYNLKDKLNINNNYVLTVDVLNISADVHAKNIRTINSGGYIFDCYIKGVFYEKIVLNLIGVHNVYNCLCALAVAYCFDLNKQKVLDFLQSFAGVERRMQLIGKCNNCKLYLDYAHHPTEIASTLNAIKQNIKSKRVLIIFQPHTYSRTKLLFSDFVKVFANSQYQMVFLPTYSAREEESCGLSAQDLYNEVKLLKTNCAYMLKRQLSKYIKQNSSNFDYAFFIGAGDLDKIAKHLVNKKKG